MKINKYKECVVHQSGKTLMHRKNDTDEKLISSIKAISENTAIERMVESKVNEGFSVYSKKALPIELHETYDTVLKEMIENVKAGKIQIDEVKKAVWDKYWAHDPETGARIKEFGDKKRAEAKAFKSAKAEIKRVKTKELKEEDQIEEEREEEDVDGRGLYKVDYIHPDKKNVGNDRFTKKSSAVEFARDLKKKGYHDVYVGTSADGPISIKEDQIEEEQLNELTGKGKLPKLRNKAVAAANKQFFKRTSTAAFKKTHAAADQAGALEYYSNKEGEAESRGNKYWLNKAKKAGDKKRKWTKEDLKEELQEGIELRLMEAYATGDMDHFNSVVDGLLDEEIEIMSENLADRYTVDAKSRVGAFAAKGIAPRPSTEASPSSPPLPTRPTGGRTRSFAAPTAAVAARKGLPPSALKQAVQGDKFQAAVSQEKAIARGRAQSARLNKPGSASMDMPNDSEKKVSVSGNMFTPDGLKKADDSRKGIVDGKQVVPQRTTSTVTRAGADALDPPVASDKTSPPLPTRPSTAATAKPASARPARVASRTPQRTGDNVLVNKGTSQERESWKQSALGMNEEAQPQNLKESLENFLETKYLKG